MSSKLRKQMIYELELRALDEKTKSSYLYALEGLVKYYNKSPEDLGVKEIRKYQHYLLTERKLKENSVNKHLAAIRFFYKNVLQRYWYVDALPRVKAPKTIPVILSEEEVLLMINSVHNVFYKAVLMLMYSTGIRNVEVRNLKINDIDKERGLINIRCGKGSRDRQALLSEVTLSALRTYWRLFRAGKKIQSEYLFAPTRNNYNNNLNKRLSHTALGYILSTASKAAGIKKK